MPRPLQILDVGGTNAFWEAAGWSDRKDVTVTLLNRFPQERVHPSILPAIGDATNLSEFADGTFDIVFSNSVIEHLFTFEKQRAMAEEVRRVGKAYWIQTPNYWFPIEPHFRTLGWHWLPLALRVLLIQKRGFGFRSRAPTPEEAHDRVAEIRLLRRTEFAALFPDGRIENEPFLGLAKSLIAVRGL